MRFEVRHGELVAVIANPRNTADSVLGLAALGMISPLYLDPLLNSTQRYMLRLKFKSKKNVVGQVLRPFGTFLQWEYDNEIIIRDLPVNIAGWQYLVLQFGLWYISHGGSKMTLENRCQEWRKKVSPWLKFLQEDGVIPLSVTWHNMRLPKESVRQPSPDRPTLLGEFPAVKVDQNDLSLPSIDKTIIGPVFWSSEVEYLDEIEKKLRLRDKLLSQCLDDHWLRKVKDYRAGCKMLKVVGDLKWSKREQEENWKFECVMTFGGAGQGRGNRVKKFKVASPVNPDGHAWALRLMHKTLMVSSDVRCLQSKFLRLHPAVNCCFLADVKDTPVKVLRESSALVEAAFDLFSIDQIYYRFLGLLNATDMAVAIAILIQEHPNMTPESLAGAYLLNRNDKSYLLLTDKIGSKIFSIDKPRAKKRKYARLSHRAMRIVRHLLRVTQPVRDLLRRANNPHWRFLFLGISSSGKAARHLGHPPNISAFNLHRADRGASLARLYPVLERNGIKSGTLDFMKIRASKGVLAWFEEGSTRACERKLGNSNRVTIEHYIPQSLLNAWNERIIRRFQNTVILLSAHDETYVLGLIDIPTVKDLEGFILQLIGEHPIHSSPVANKLHEVFGSKFGCDISSKRSRSGQLYLQLSANSIALLLAYRKWASENLSVDAQNEIDHVTGVAPKYFIDLAVMIQAVSVNNELGDKLKESLDVSKLKRYYHEALKQVSSVIVGINKMRINLMAEISL